MNDSGAHGNADVKFHRNRPHQAHVDIDAFRLAKGLPHGPHIARHECPTVRDDDDNNQRINVVEGLRSTAASSSR